eukprot:6538196-Prymnesium_polylepis.1
MRYVAGSGCSTHSRERNPNRSRLLRPRPRRRARGVPACASECDRAVCGPVGRENGGRSGLICGCPV